MILVTTDTIEGREVSHVLGMVRGNTIRVRTVGRDLVAGIRGLIGGEVVEYTKLMAESREQALDRMIEEATRLGADAIVGVRFSTAEVMRHAAEILVYGTAVKLRS